MMGVLIAAIADFIVFDVGIKHGMRIVDAHLASAAVAVVILYLAKVRGPAVAAGRGGDIRLHVEDNVGAAKIKLTPEEMTRLS